MTEPFKVHPGLIASDFIITENDCSFRVWLWETQEGLKTWAYRYAAGRDKKGRFDDSIGLFSPSQCLVHDRASHIGEIHFIKDRWDEEIVAHELAHAQFQYIRKQVEDFVRPLYQFYTEWMEWEEELCYPFGQWHKWTWRWLWKKNPNPKWIKTNVST